MGFKEWIIPQDRVFYDLLEKNAELSIEAVGAFRHMMSNWNALHAERNRVHEIEGRADAVSHEIFDRLNRTFITPMDREDIARLTHVLDDVVDSVDDAANRIFLYELPAPTPEMLEFCTILEKQVAQVQLAVKSLRKPATMAKVLPGCGIEIHRLENEADRLLDRVTARLFKEKDAVTILKHKEVYEFLERATDKCEDVADVMQDILRKHG